MEEDNSNFINSFEKNLSRIDKKKGIFNTNTGTIEKDYSDCHYICEKCNKFPFLKFCKDRKNVKLTCSCFNNKKILIEKLDKNLTIEDSVSLFLSKTQTNTEKELECKKHNIKFTSFSHFYLNNYCEKCYLDKMELNDYDTTKFDDIRIEEKKIEDLKKR